MSARPDPPARPLLLFPLPLINLVLELEHNGLNAGQVTFHYFVYLTYSSGSRLETIPSANLRQQKLEQQRLKIEQKQKQKREAGKLIQASDLKSASSVKRSGGRPLSGRRELHGYEGPLQFLHGNNPDEMTTVQV